MIFKDLEDFIASSGEKGFIYVSMGSGIRMENMKDASRRLFIDAFASLPYHVIWKNESATADLNLPDNVKTFRWLPQQDILGHSKLKAFVTQGGILSMFEAVFHGVPAVVLPVFCDQDSNAEKQKADGYGKYRIQSYKISQNSFL